MRHVLKHDESSRLAAGRNLTSLKEGSSRYRREICLAACSEGGAGNAHLSCLAFGGSGNEYMDVAQRGKHV